MKRKMKQLTLYCLNGPSLSPMRGEGWSMGMGLHSFQQFREFCQCNDINIRKGRLAEYIKMMAVGYDISVKDYFHRLFQFVEIHLIDFVESLLIKLPRLPQFIKPPLHFSRIMAVKYVLQLLEPILTLVQGEHLKQMNLQWIENGCFHNYNFLPSAAKIQQIIK